MIGRAKLSNVEMDDDVKPSNSHVALNTIVEPDGTQRQILRENMPFGSLGAGEFGTYFIGYAATPSVTELMLQHMFLGDPPGNYDRILDFSTAVTGTFSSCPRRTSSTILRRCRRRRRRDTGGEGERRRSRGEEQPAVGGDGSLGIGGLTAGRDAVGSSLPRARRVIGQDRSPRDDALRDGEMLTGGHVYLEFTEEQRNLQRQLREYFEGLVADVEGSAPDEPPTPGTSAGWATTAGWASGGPSNTAVRPGGPSIR